jgi:hypothetical protein
MSSPRIVLLAVLVISTAALAYNAFSIVQGQSGFERATEQLLPR